MKNRSYLLIAVGIIVLFAAMIGFFITLDVSPQIAYARLFIDVGLGLGVMSLVLAFFKEPDLPTAGLIKALASLKTGKYDTRLGTEGLGSLQALATGINELAQTLEGNFKKQEEIKRNLRAELLPSFKEREKDKEVTVVAAPAEAHSIHPELGPVQAIIPPLVTLKSEPAVRTQVAPAPLFSEPKAEALLSNTLFQSNPPAEPATFSEVATSEIPTPNDEMVLEEEEQDLGELYQLFIEAQSRHHLMKTEYTVFLKTIETSKAELLAAHLCRDVHFDVVDHHSQVALQPKLLR